MAQAIGFIVIGALLLSLTALAMIRLAMLRLESPLGRREDGLTPGTSAPTWRVTDTVGTPRYVPSESNRQALLFADHSLVSFPKLVSGLLRLQEDAPDLELIMLSRVDAGVTAKACELLGLEVPLVIVDDRFYKRHNVWVMPHILFLDEHGTVLVAGNVAEPTGLANMWRHAQLTASTAKSGAVG